jgi:NitT/TauT family transport system substrate-binding protein
MQNLSGRWAGIPARSAHELTRRELIVSSGRLALIGASLAAGLGRPRPAGAASQVTIGVVGTPCHAPTYTTLAQGFFKDEGLDATVVELGNNGTIPAVAAGNVDAGLGVMWQMVPPRLPTGRALGDVVMTAALQRGCIALSVPTDSDVQSLGDLRGKKVAGSQFLYAAALIDAGLDPTADIVWSPAPADGDVFTTLQSGEFAAVQSANGEAALLEGVGAARMLVVNNTPPAENNYCCVCVMQPSSVSGDRPRAVAITRALMRGSVWAEAHRSETAEIMRPSMTIPTPRELSQEDMEAALAMQAFIPMAEAARPLLIDQFDQYLRYGLMTVDTPMDATNLVSRIFMPLTQEVQIA